MINIIPVKDNHPHIVSDACDCSPKIHIENDVKIVIHNAYDQREIIEEAIVKADIDNFSFGGWKVVK